MFDPAEHIGIIRKLYEDHEGWLAPFPWCEQHLFNLDKIFTRLKFVKKRKQGGARTGRIVDMFQIFEPHEECSQPKRVLIEGQPGMGKTTFSHKIAYDWAKEQTGEDSFPEVVLLLKCRDITSGLWEAIYDQLLPMEMDEQDKQRFFAFIREHQSKVLLALDGLDELPTSLLPDYKKIVEGRNLPNCYLVVTARHEVGITVRNCCHTLLEVEGFTKSDAEEFIKKYFQEKKNLAKELIEELNSDTTLQDLIASPLNTALLCLLCEDFNGKLPKSRTLLYLEIVECLLRRYHRKTKTTEADQDLLALYQVQLKYLGHLALDCLKNDSMYFEQSEFRGSRDLINGLGFLSVEAGRSNRRPSRRYGFLHRSFQEFLAAFYLCCQLEDGEILPGSFVADYQYFRKFKQVLMFTTSMLAQRSEAKAKSLIASVASQVDGSCEDRGTYLYVALCCINECVEEPRRAELAQHLGSCLEISSCFFDER